MGKFQHWSVEEVSCCFWQNDATRCWSETTWVCFSHSIHPNPSISIHLGAWSINTTQNLILQVPHNALQISSIHIFQGIIFIILRPIHHKLHEFSIAWTQQCRCHGFSNGSNGWSGNVVTGCYQVTAPWPRVLMVEVASWKSHLFYEVYYIPWWFASRISLKHQQI